MLRDFEHACCDAVMLSYCDACNGPCCSLDFLTIPILCPFWILVPFSLSMLFPPFPSQDPRRLLAEQIISPTYLFSPYSTVREKEQQEGDQKEKAKGTSII
jgi:hypothetical protein